MPKVVKNTTAVLLSLTAVSAIMLRIIQLIKFTDIETGYIYQSATQSMHIFYIICFVMIVLSAIISYKSKCCNNPFEKEKSKTLSLFSFFAGISLFYDFVHQSVNCYEYISKNSQLQMNYLFPLVFVGISALACSFYFFLMGSYFVSDKYDFRQFKYFHLMPTAWILFKLLICIVTYVDERYAEEVFFQYELLIFGVCFYIFIIRCIDDDCFNLRHLAFTGISYALCSLIISIPRIVVWLMNAETSSVTFSSVTYLFTGLFALIFSVNILKPTKND